MTVKRLLFGVHSFVIFKLLLRGQFQTAKSAFIGSVGVGRYKMVRVQLPSGELETAFRAYTGLLLSVHFPHVGVFPLLVHASLSTYPTNITPARRRFGQVLVPFGVCRETFLTFLADLLVVMGTGYVSL